MLISDSRRMLFVHIPKTGGVSVEQVLRESIDDGRNHGKVRHPRLRRILATEPGLADYWTFGFVRNPWSRMWSWWSMIDRWNHHLGPASGKPQTEQDGPRGGNAMWRAVAQYADFEEFCLRGPQEHARLGHPQVSFLTAPGRRADFVGRTEHLARDLRVVQDRLGLPPTEAPRRNSWSKGHYTEAYTPAAREHIGAVYAADVAEFGYRYGD